MNKFEAIEQRRAAEVRELERLREEVRRAEYRIAQLDAAMTHARSEAQVGEDGPTHCGGCGADVSTERLFSLHYVIPDARLYNIGHCPVVGPRN